jgi:hypothetical protein
VSPRSQAHDPRVEPDTVPSRESAKREMDYADHVMRLTDKVEQYNAELRAENLKIQARLAKYESPDQPAIIRAQAAAEAETLLNVARSAAADVVRLAGRRADMVSLTAGSPPIDPRLLPSPPLPPIAETGKLSEDSGLHITIPVEESQKRDLEVIALRKLVAKQLAASKWHMGNGARLAVFGCAAILLLVINGLLVLGLRH